MFKWLANLFISNEALLIETPNTDMKISNNVYVDTANTVSSSYSNTIPVSSAVDEVPKIYNPRSYNETLYTRNLAPSKISTKANYDWDAEKARKKREFDERAEKKRRDDDDNTALLAAAAVVASSWGSSSSSSDSSSSWSSSSDSSSSFGGGDSGGGGSSGDF